LTINLLLGGISLTEEKDDTVPKEGISTKGPSIGILFDEDSNPGLGESADTEVGNYQETRMSDHNKPGAVNIIGEVDLVGKTAQLPSDFLSLPLLKGYRDFFRDDSFLKREITSRNMITGLLLIVISAVLIAFISNLYIQLFGYGSFSLKDFEFMGLVRGIFKSIFLGLLNSIILAGLVFGALKTDSNNTDIKETLTLAGFISGFSLIYTIVVTAIRIIGLPDALVVIFSTAISLLPFAIVLSFLIQAKGLNLRLAVSISLLVFTTHAFITRLIS
jgi:hypothetical protein